MKLYRLIFGMLVSVHICRNKYNTSQRGAVIEGPYLRPYLLHPQHHIGRTFANPLSFFICMQEHFLLLLFFIIAHFYFLICTIFRMNTLQSISEG